MPATEESAIQFWGLRPFRLLGSFAVQEWINNRNSLEQQRQQRQDGKKDAFLQKHNLTANDNEDLPCLYISDNLTFWAKFLSWTFCNNC